MDIAVVNISEGPNELNSGVLDNLELSILSFNVTPRLRYSDKSDYVGFQLDLMVMQENTQVFRSGFLVGPPSILKIKKQPFRRLLFLYILW